MKNELERLMTSLRSDHRNMALLLDLLDAESELLEASTAPDFGLVADIMRYITEYPDVVHHPREDVIYEHLKRVHPEVATSLQRVLADHEYIEETGLQLKKDLEALSAGADKNRERIIANLRYYSEKLREHMHWEEKELFARADELQCDENLSTALEEGAAIDDPLFGSKVKRKYRKLLARIQQRVAWDSQKYMV